MCDSFLLIGGKNMYTNMNKNININNPLGLVGDYVNKLNEVGPFFDRYDYPKSPVNDILDNLYQKRLKPLDDKMIIKIYF